jgi:F420H(2)-dependent quinone reductase
MSRQSFFASFHVFFYRLSKGRLGGRFRGASVLLLTTTGRKTGKKRTTPLLYVKEGNRLAIVASNGGRDHNPSWWTNLGFNPQGEVQIKGEKWQVKAEKASDSEKTRLWPLLAKAYPSYDDYQRKTKREIPVVILTASTRPTVELTGTRQRQDAF